MKVKMEGYCEEIINFLPDATFVIDLEGKVIAWNMEMENITRVPSSQIIGKGDYEYAIPFYGTRKPMLANLILMPDADVEKRYNSVIKDGDTLVVDIFIPGFGKNGTYFWAKASPLYDPGGNIVGAIETIRDITDRIFAEKEIKKTVQRLEQIINFLPDPTFVIDLEGKVIAWNRAMEDITGVPSSQVVGKGDYEYAIPFYGTRKPMLANLILMPDEEVDNRYNSVVRDGDTLVVDIFIPGFGKNGTYFWAKASPLYDSIGNITGAIETIRDITDRREMEELLARSKAELEIAADIQRSFLPDNIPVIQGFDVAATSVMAKEVGGDFFDVIPMDLVPMENGSFAILIADVSGKGIPAALFMALSRIVVRVNAIWHHEPAKVITDANNIIVQDSKAGMFVTLFYGILSEQSRTMTYVNAGHNPPLIYRTGCDVFEELTNTGIAIGVLEGENFSQKSVKIDPGDILVLYTDGITESFSSQNEMFGESRLKSIIRKNASLSAVEIQDKIFNEVQIFSESEPQFDDITLLVIKALK